MQDDQVACSLARHPSLQPVLSTPSGVVIPLWCGRHRALGRFSLLSFHFPPLSPLAFRLPHLSHMLQIRTRPQSPFVSLPLASAHAGHRMLVTGCEHNPVQGFQRVWLQFPASLRTQLPIRINRKYVYPLATVAWRLWIRRRFQIGKVPFPFGLLNRLDWTQQKMLVGGGGCRGWERGWGLMTPASFEKSWHAQ